jgi:hypothetical protein
MMRKYLPRIMSISARRVGAIVLLDLEVTRDLDGIPVSFSKSTPSGFLVTDINGKSGIVSRERWAELPYWKIAARQKRAALAAPSHEAWVIAILGLVLAACSGIAFVLSLTTSAVRKLYHLLWQRNAPVGASR